jgi:hypothetical protein
LNAFLDNHSDRIACLQETRLTAKLKNPGFPGYTLLRIDRPIGNGSGIAILVYHSVGYTSLDTSTLTLGDDVIELLGIMATINGFPINVFNVYLPPPLPAHPVTNLTLTVSLDSLIADSIVLGDFNAHHAAWFATSSCTRGNDLAGIIEDSSFCSLNCDTPTHLPDHGNPNSPDLSLISAHLAPSAVWGTQVNLNSDHFPITIDLGGDDSPPPRFARAFTNF